MLRLASSWPLPALLAWLAVWIAHRTLVQFGLPPGPAALAAAGLGCLLALAADTRWRRIFIAAGFPLSLMVSGVLTGAAALIWLAPLLALLLLYPLASWRDAPLYPTPTGALRGIAGVAPLEPGARILDAGCGLGAGLAELQRRYPRAELVGFEWSRPLAITCRLRHRSAKVVRADIWRAAWSGYRMVYLFQRPESMARAVAKASRELAPGAWLVSLEFPATGLQPERRIEAVAGKPVWLYRAPFVATTGALPDDAAAMAAVDETPALRRPSVSMKSTTSSSTGASQRSGQAKAPASVRWLARG